MCYRDTGAPLHQSHLLQNLQAIYIIESLPLLAVQILKDRQVIFSLRIRVRFSIRKVESNFKTY